MTGRSGSTEAGTPRRPAVDGSFYPADAGELRVLVDELLGQAGRLAEETPGAGGSGGAPARLLGLLVPHAGLVYSGVVAAAGWRCLGELATGPTVVILGTNHGAGWLDGVGAWDRGAWRTPLGDVEVDADLAAAILDLGPPFVIDRAAHLREHSIEVQLPILRTVSPEARIVPLAVSTGTGGQAISAGERLGALLAGCRRAGAPVVLGISSDMAHYPAHAACARATELLLPAILALEPEQLALRERALVQGRTAGLACGMCGIEPTVLGLAALRAAGSARGVPLAAATSADAGGPPDRTVGYLAARFDQDRDGAGGSTGDARAPLPR